MLSCAEYRLLEESLQVQLTWLDGIFLMSRRTEKLTIHLFSLYSFYVEVFFEDSEPFFITAFDDVIYLDPYLKAIDIDFLFNEV